MLKIRCMKDHSGKMRIDTNAIIWENPDGVCFVCSINPFLREVTLSPTKFCISEMNGISRKRANIHSY